jgi:hypothetical protein
MFLARERMDTLTAFQPPTDGITPSIFANAQTYDDPDPIQVGSDAEDGTRYTRRTQIIPNQPSIGLARVVVTVVWANANSAGGTQQTQLTSVMRIN